MTGDPSFVNCLHTLFNICLQAARKRISMQLCISNEVQIYLTRFDDGKWLRFILRLSIG